MNTILKYLCVLTLLKLVTCIQLAVILYPQNEDANTVLRSDDEIEGIFTTFIRNLFEVLPKIPRRKLVKYFKMAAEEVHKFEYRMMRKLYKHLRDLSKTDGYELQIEIGSYREMLEDVTPQTKDFLQAINRAFTLQHSVRFNDYIFDIRDYGNGDKLFIRHETRSILEVIVGAVEKMSVKDQNNIEKKLKKVINL